MFTHRKPINKINRKKVMNEKLMLSMRCIQPVVPGVYTPI